MPRVKNKLLLLLLGITFFDVAVDFVPRDPGLGGSGSVARENDVTAHVCSDVTGNVDDRRRNCIQTHHTTALSQL